MSVRYGISLTLDPAFTAGLHRARQVICSQYGCWAAEMHSVYLPLTGYFPCHEQELPSLAVILEKIAEEFQLEHRNAILAREGIVAEAEGGGNVFLAFSDESGTAAASGSVSQLQGDIAEALSRMNLMVGGELLPLRFALLQHSGLSSQVFRSAARFAEGVVNGLQLPASVALSELTLFRYESAAAGDDWEEGSWATDLSWKIIDVYPLDATD